MLKEMLAELVDSHSEQRKELGRREIDIEELRDTVMRLTAANAVLESKLRALEAFKAELYSSRDSQIAAAARVTYGDMAAESLAARGV